MLLVKRDTPPRSALIMRRFLHAYVLNIVLIDC